MPIGARSRLQIATMLAAVLGPLLLLLVLAWVQILVESGTLVEHYATLTVDRADRIFANAEATLADMSAHIEPRCTPQTVEALRKVLGAGHPLPGRHPGHRRQDSCATPTT